jgi:hypothetical protein
MKKRNRNKFVTRLPWPSGRENNTEFITRLMDTDPLVNIFIMNAVISYSEKVVKDEAKVLKEMENSFVHGPAWVDAAKKLQTELEKHTRRF